MSYSNRRVITYNYGAVDMGAGTVTKRVRVPRGARAAIVEDISANVTEAFTQDTTPGLVQVGIASDLDLMAELNMGAAAINTAYGMRDNAAAHKGEWRKDSNDVDTLVFTFVAPTGGTPAGIADFAISIGWDFVDTH